MMTIIAAKEMNSCIEYVAMTPALIASKYKNCNNTGNMITYAYAAPAKNKQIEDVATSIQEYLPMPNKLTELILPFSALFT